MASTIQNRGAELTEKKRGGACPGSDRPTKSTAGVRLRSGQLYIFKHNRKFYIIQMYATSYDF